MDSVCIEHEFGNIIMSFFNYVTVLECTVEMTLEVVMNNGVALPTNRLYHSATGYFEFIILRP